jgi:glycosyltransferase involved in cell wall biosynthesis
MILRRKKSVLFVRPDYHCSFFYRDQFRKLGWKADIYVPWNYPEQLLYSEVGIKRPFRFSKSNRRPARYFNHAASLLWFLFNFWRYSFHLYYGRPPQWNFGENKLPIIKGKPGNWNLSLWLSNLLGCKLVYLPSGCHDEFSKAEFSQLDEGNICNNCGVWDRCNDTLNINNFERVRRYFSGAIGTGSVVSTQYQATQMRWKTIDLNLWNPLLEIPVEHRLPVAESIRVLHSFSSNGRDYLGRSIKGSPFISDAVTRLQDEGFNVEFLYLTDIASRDMRFYQAQADIIVEQLRYGWWGSTGVETMALGKPVVCYMRPAWKDTFERTFAEGGEVPIIEASVDNIYEVLRELVSSEELRIKAGRASRSFAEKHFDPTRNSKAFADFLLNL